MKKFRKVLSIVLAVLMLASVAAFSASAAATPTVVEKGTAVKLLPADEPLVAAGSTTAFELTYPTA